MNRTKIEYLDYTLNIIVGCSGEGCSVRSKCWAMRQAKRRKGKCKDDRCYRFVPHDHPERLWEPLRVRTPSRIGLNFSGETFDKNLKNRELVWFGLCGMMRKAAWHMFFVLTKQPQNIPTDTNFPLPENLWLGVTVNCKDDLWRIEALKKTTATVKCISFEPLYSNLYPLDLNGINWIIIGAQTRPLLKPKPDWVQYIKSQATSLGIPVFEKNNLGQTVPIQEFPKTPLGAIRT